MQRQPIPQGILVISIFTVITGIISLSIGFIYPFFKLNIFTNYNLINPTNIFFMFFQPVIISLLQFLAIINLIISISLFATCYGLIQKEEWSRRIIIKFTFVAIVIALVNILFYVLIFNDLKNIMIILFSIVIGCSIVSIYLLYSSNMKAYFNRLTMFENEKENKIDNSL